MALAWDYQGAQVQDLGSRLAGHPVHSWSRRHHRQTLCGPCGKPPLYVHHGLKAKDLGQAHGSLGGACARPTHDMHDRPMPVLIQLPLPHCRGQLVQGDAARTLDMAW